MIDLLMSLRPDYPAGDAINCMLRRYLTEVPTPTEKMSVSIGNKDTNGCRATGAERGKVMAKFVRDWQVSWDRASDDRPQGK